MSAATTVSSSSGRLRRSWLPATAVHYIVWTISMVLVVAPVVPIVWASLWSTPLYDDGGSLTVGNFGRLFADSDWWSSVGNSISFAVLTTGGALVVGGVLAVLLTRTDMPGRTLFSTLVLIPVGLPGLVLIFGWSTMWAPFGYATQWVRKHTPLPVPIDLYSVPGMSIVAITVAAPVVFLYVRGTLAALDSSLEDAARSAGASPLRALWTVTVPMLRPAMLNSGLIVFTLALEVLGLPLILGSSSNIHFISTYLYNNWVNKVPSDQGLVSAGAIVLLAVVTVLLVVRNKLTGDVARFTTTTGKPRATATLRLGPVRWLLSAVVALTITVTMIVPLIGIVLQAFTSILTPFVSPWKVLTTEHFHSVFTNPVYRQAVRNSLLIASIGGALATIGIAILAVVAHRSSFRYRRSLQQVVLYPRAVPGIITGMAFFWAYAVLDRGGSFRGTLWAMGIAFAVRSLALGYSAFYPALAALGEDLDRAARTSGASWWMAMRHVVFRLVRPAMVVSFLLMFIAMLNDADPAVMLVGPHTQVMGLAMLQLSLSGVAGPVAAFGVIQLAITMVLLVIIKVVTLGRRHA